MTNSEKIMMDCIRKGVYTTEEVKAFLAKGQSLPIHTSYEWKQLGYHIRKGEHARLKTKLWKMVPGSDSDNPGGEKEPQFYLADAFLFTENQVESFKEEAPEETESTEEVFK